MNLTLDTDRRLLRAAGHSVRYLHLALQAPTATQARAPVDLALVLDRSGSMGGNKWPQAQAAALQALGRLNAQDRAAMVVGLDHNPAHPRHAATSASAGRLSGRGRFRRGGGGRSTCASTCSNRAG